MKSSNLKFRSKIGSKPFNFNPSFKNLSIRSFSVSKLPAFQKFSTNYFVLQESKRFEFSKRKFSIVNLKETELEHLNEKKANDDKEITLYIKGFLSEGELPDHFEHWLASHKALSK